MGLRHNVRNTGMTHVAPRTRLGPFLLFLAGCTGVGDDVVSARQGLDVFPPDGLVTKGVLGPSVIQAGKPFSLAGFIECTTPPCADGMTLPQVEIETSKGAAGNFYLQFAGTQFFVEEKPGVLVDHTEHVRYSLAEWAGGELEYVEHASQLSLEGEDCKCSSRTFAVTALPPYDEKGFPICEGCRWEIRATAPPALPPGSWVAVASMGPFDPKVNFGGVVDAPTTDPPGDFDWSKLPFWGNEKLLFVGASFWGREIICLDWPSIAESVPRACWPWTRSGGFEYHYVPQ
jgi:hypothetical protein